MNKSQLKEFAEEIAREIEREVRQSDIQAIQDKILKLSTLTSLCASVLAEAKKHYELKKMEALVKYKDGGLQPSILVKFIDGHCAEESSFFLYCEKLNSGITNSIDGLRSILSLYKTELQNSLHQ